MFINYTKSLFIEVFMYQSVIKMENSFINKLIKNIKQMIEFNN